MNAKSGFTLIELVVVITIMAMLASLAYYSLAGVRDRYQLSQSIEAIERFDARARRQARRIGTAVTTVVNRRNGRLSLSLPNRRPVHTSQLPNQIEITEVRLGRSALLGSQFELKINGDGQSATYGLQLQRGSAQSWLVVLGLSGQVIPLQSEAEFDAILSL